MKLIIQIPCHNEATTLPVTLGNLPRKVTGFDTVEWLIINDGSSDDTLIAAKNLGVNHFVNITRKRGLANGFMAGLRKCILEGADIIVNTDGDNQYCADDITKIIAPIIEGSADFVIGERPIMEIRHFSKIKKILQRTGSRVVRFVSKTNVQDAPCGFRAMSRECAMQLNVFNDYTYTLETIMQAGIKGIAVTSVPIRVNPDLRQSRLIKSMSQYILKSTATIIRTLFVYKPFKIFFILGATLVLAGTLLGVRFLYLKHTGHSAGNIQSVVLSGALLGMGFQTVLIAFISDILAVNRKILEDIRYDLLSKTSCHRPEVK